MKNLLMASKFRGDDDDGDASGDGFRGWKRTRSGGSDFEGFGGPRGRRLARGSRFEEGKPFSRSSGTSRRFDSPRDGNAGGDFFFRKKNHRVQEDRRSSFSSDRRFGARKVGESSSSSLSSWNSRVSKRLNDGEVSPRKGGTRLQSPTKKGSGGDRRVMEFGYKRGATGSRKQVALLSEDDEEDEDEDEDRVGSVEASKFGIGDLISESDTDEEEDGESVGNGNVVAKEIAKGSPVQCCSDLHQKNLPISKAETS